MYFLLVVAIYATLCWLNVMFSEHITAKVNPYVKPEDTTDIQRAKIKNILIIIMALFWSAVVLYW
jgi:hypothetical protein